MAGFYDDPNSPGYNSGIGQVKRAAARAQEDSAVAANPIGPPSLVTPPDPNNGIRGGVRVNPPASTLAQEGALRPTSGPWSPSNPQPQLDAVGNVVRPVPMPTIAAPTSSQTPSGPAPTIASVTPATAANANELRAITNPAAPVRSDGGRLLGYGQVVNGVRTFSDGSGGPTAPPRTMSDADIANLAKEGRLSHADAGIGGGIGSEAFSLARPAPTAAGAVLANTPELGSDAGYALTRPAASGGMFHMPSPAAQAATDAASIIGRDTRSPLGLAMRNFDVEVKGRTHPGRAAAAAALGAPSVEGARQAGALAQENAQQAGALARTQLDANAGIQRELIARRPQPRDITLADGTLGVLGGDNVLRPAVDAQGNPVRPQVGKPAVDLPTYGKMLSENVNRLLGVDPVSGLIATQDGKGRSPTAEELYNATQTARTLTDGAFGSGGQSATSPRPTLEAFLSAARRANPRATDQQLTDYYKANYAQ